MEDAFRFAENAHKTQRRASNEPFISHPVQVADLLISLGMDYETIAAALLHDVLEDTPVKAEALASEFGQSIAGLVLGVTKLDKITFSSREQEQAENFRKMFFAMANDIRVIIIKLADRVHNMRTVSYLPYERQQAIAAETLDIYAPLASRLGLSYLKCELEDLSLKTMHPVVYEALVAEVNMKREERQKEVNLLIDEIKKLLADWGIKGEVSGRPKHFYSIYRKMVTQNRSFSEIYDLTAIRVIVDTIDQCYEVLGRIHTKWKPIPGLLKDFIAVPKANNYQSLHTTVITPYGSPFEIQIRTVEMHRIAEYGVAAHWKYKEKREKDTDFDSTVSWLRQTMDTQKALDEDPKEFYSTLKMDLYGGQIFTFTPKGDVIVLPKGATPVDFAYKVHAEVGNKCVGAKVNNKITPLDTKLKTGNRIEILTNKNSKGPKRDWLNFVISGTAKSRIRSFFRKEDEALSKQSDMQKPKENPTAKSMEVIITAADSKGLLANVTGAISALKLSIKAINAVEKSHQAVITVDIAMKRGVEPEAVLKQIKQIKGIKTVFINSQSKFYNDTRRN